MPQAWNRVKDTEGYVDHIRADGQYKAAQGYDKGQIWALFVLDSRGAWRWLLDRPSLSEVKAEADEITHRAQRPPEDDPRMQDLSDDSPQDESDV